MTHSRRAALRTMLETRRDAILGQIQQRLRAFRDTDSSETQRLPTDLSDDPIPGDLDFALVEMQGQTLDLIQAAIARLDAGEFGVCHDCEEEIPENRLRAMPFAVRCRDCQETAERIQVRDRRAAQRGVRLGLISSQSF